MSPSALMLIAMLAWGLWSLCDKVALRTLHPGQSMFIFCAVTGALTPLAWWLLRPAGPVRWESAGVGWAAAAALFSALATLVYLYALRHREAGIVAGYTSAYPVITCVLGALLLGESLTATKIAALGLVLGGLWLLGQA